MSKTAESLTWERSRVGKSDLLMLVKIADLTDDDGRNCFAEVPRLAKACRLSERGAQYILHRLLASGEIEIDYNEDGREIVLRGGRRFRPKWFINVRCVCAWEEYQEETGKRANLADSRASLRPGRPRRQPAKIANYFETRNPQSFQRNAKPASEKPEKTRIAYIEEGSVSDPLVEQEQGAAPLIHIPKTTDFDPERNLAVVTKLAHETLELRALTTDVSYGEIVDAVKGRCALLGIDYRGIVHRAIDAAVFQRLRVGKPPVISDTAAEAAARLQNGAQH